MIGLPSLGLGAGSYGPSVLSKCDFVIDSGVAIKWYVPENHEAEAKRFLDPAYMLHVPELFYPQFGNVLWKKACLLKSPEISVDEGRRILQLLRGISVTVHPMAPLLELAYDLAVSPERPVVYDACYLILAKMLGCRLVTADRPFYDAFKDGSYGPLLLWVADSP
jgi:predicted nucleic acid-binding protein